MEYLLVLSILLLVVGFWLSSVSMPRYLRGSALNPFVFILSLFIFFVLDFVDLHTWMQIDLYEELLVLDEKIVLIGFAYFLSCVLVFVLALGMALAAKPPKRSYMVRIIGDDDAGEIVFWVVLILAFGGSVYLIATGGMWSGDISKQVLFKENKLLPIVFSMLPPAFALFCVGQHPLSKKCLFALLAASIMVLATNSRGSLVLIFIIYGYLFNYRVRRINSLALIAAVPIVGVLLLWSRYVFREAWRYDSISDFIGDQGGVFAVFFHTAEISMAEVITTAIGWGQGIRYPFESFLAALMYPLPRSIFTFKPLGSGGDFTAEFSPLRWELTKSEIVTTGFGDLLLQFGWVGSLLTLFFLVFFWARTVKNIALTSPSQSIFFVPLLMWWGYIFVRADIFNMGGAIWSAMLVLALLNGIRRVRRVR